MARAPSAREDAGVATDDGLAETSSFVPDALEEHTFEETFNQLAETVAQLEQGGLPLEMSVALYEQGVRLAAACRAMLERAELQLSRLDDEIGVLPDDEA
jgi:exodeoxyribonuclease VII small subunit